MAEKFYRKLCRKTSQLNTNFFKTSYSCIQNSTIFLPVLQTCACRVNLI